VLEHGFIDAIVPRPELRSTLAHLLRFCGAPVAPPAGAGAASEHDARSFKKAL